MWKYTFICSSFRNKDKAKFSILKKVFYFRKLPTILADANNSIGYYPLTAEEIGQLLGGN